MNDKNWTTNLNVIWSTPWYGYSSEKFLFQTYFLLDDSPVTYKRCSIVYLRGFFVVPTKYEVAWPHLCSTVEYSPILFCSDIWRVKNLRKIISMQIFCVKNQFDLVLKRFSIETTGLGEQLQLVTFLDSLHFWNSLFSKNMPYFWLFFNVKVISKFWQDLSCASLYSKSVVMLIWTHRTLYTTS